MTEVSMEVVVDGKKRTLIQIPEFGKLYWLGYHSTSGGLYREFGSVFGAYFGIYEGTEPIFGPYADHLFLAKNKDNGNIDRYVCSAGKLFVAWYGDCGDDEPSFPGLSVRFEGIFPEGPEKEIAAKRLEQIIAIDELKRKRYYEKLNRSAA